MSNKSGRRAQSVSPRRMLRRIASTSDPWNKIAVIEKVLSWTEVPYDPEFFCGDYALLAPPAKFGDKAPLWVQAVGKRPRAENAQNCFLSFLLSTVPARPAVRLLQRATDRGKLTVHCGAYR
jgi:hypothetical protein